VTRTELKGLSGQSPATVVVMPDTSRTAYYCIWEELLSAILGTQLKPRLSDHMSIQVAGRPGRDVSAKTGAGTRRV
jgi:hypothetical protein